jgi:hypothetical protein
MGKGVTDVISKSLVIGVGLAGVGLGLAGAFSTPADATGITYSCSASTVIGSCVGSFVTNTCNTDWTNVHVGIDLFNTSVYAPMTSFSLVVSGTIQFLAGSIITNGGSSTETAIQSETSTFSFTTTNSGLQAALNALSPPTQATTSQTTTSLAPGHIFTLSTVPVTGFSSTVNGGSFLSDFEAAGGGTSTITVNTTTFNNLAYTGGNTTSSVSTADTLTLSWVYNYGVAAPEPVSLSILGSGLFGLGLLRRRKRNRAA